ncbi:BRE1A ligase, partial [Amia calva]|nr:BRE1A ligase [Amia calva]
MSGLKRPGDPSTSAPPEKRREREREEAEEGGAGGGSTAVETVIKLGGVSNTEEQDIRALQVKNRKLGESLDQRQVIEDELRERAERLERRQATDDASLLILNRYWSQVREGGAVSLSVQSLSQCSLSLSAVSLSVQSLSQCSLSLSAVSLSVQSLSQCSLSLSAVSLSVQSLSQCSLSLSAVSLSVQSLSQCSLSLSAVSLSVQSLSQCSLSLSAVSLSVQSLSQCSLSLSAVSLSVQSLSQCSLSLSAVSLSVQSLSQCSLSLSAVSLSVQSLSQCSLSLSAVSLSVQSLSQCSLSLSAVSLSVQSLSQCSLSLSAVSLSVQSLSQCSLSLSAVSLSVQSLSQCSLSLSAVSLSVQSLSQCSLSLSAVSLSVQSLSQCSLSLSAVSLSVQSLSQCSLSLSAVSLSVQSLSQCSLSLSAVSLSVQSLSQCSLSLSANDEVGLQRKVRTEVIQLEDTLAQVRKEYEMLRIEFEQTLAANEQAGPINREMRHLISTLQNHNQQMKGEVQKYKLRLREAQSELSKARAVKGSSLLQSQSSTELDVKEETASPLTPSTSRFSVKVEPGTESEGSIKEEEREKARGGGAAVKEERERTGSSSQPDDLGPERLAVIGGAKRKEVEQLKIVRAELKVQSVSVSVKLLSLCRKAQESQREMKLLLDMYRSAPKEQRDKVQLMAAERKAKSEAEDLRQRLRELEERERREGKKMADEEALRKIRSVEDQIDTLNKKLSLAKQEEEALLSEMDVTGQAFEDMQEQNIRLMQQLREKDDANFKLMSERIKSNQIHKLLKEEKEELADQLLTLKTQVDAQLQVVRKLEEKERLLQGTIGTAERELNLRTQALDLNKRKALESLQQSEELRVQMDSVQVRLNAVREEVIENSISREKESFNARRAQEDISKLRRKLENAKKPEDIPNCDEILNEEINDYKARLTCPCCNSRVKDAVLTKCFHVFCFECVKTRYDTRQRKCPKCNAAFGANDFHRIYIG